MMDRSAEYSAAVSRLCDMVSAKSVLEVGLGIMQSGKAIVKSLSGRRPGKLHTIDWSTDKLPDDVRQWAESFGVTWTVERGDACGTATESGLTKSFTGLYDLIHVDSVGPEKTNNLAVWNNIGSLVRPGGIFAIAGASSEYQGILDACNEIGGFSLERWCRDYGHAVRFC